MIKTIIKVKVKKKLYYISITAKNKRLVRALQLTRCYVTFISVEDFNPLYFVYFFQVNNPKRHILPCSVHPCSQIPVNSP